MHRIGLLLFLSLTECAPLSLAGQAAKSLEIPKKLSSATTDTAGVHFKRGQKLFQAGLFTKAAREFEQAALLSPQTFELWANAGISYFNAGEYSHAARAFFKVAILRPHDPVTHFHLGLAYARDKKPEQAIFEYRKAIELDSRAPSSYVELGKVLSERREHTEAVKMLRRAVELAPEKRDNWLDLGAALTLAGWYEEGLKTYQAIQNKWPDTPEIYYYLGHAYRILGQPERARHELELELARSPNHVNGWRNLALLELEAGQEDHALELFHKVVALRPAHHWAQYDLGRLYLKRKNYLRAIQHLKRSIELNPEFPGAYYQLYLAHSRNQEPELARQAHLNFLRLAESRRGETDQLQAYPEGTPGEDVGAASPPSPPLR